MSSKTINTLTLEGLYLLFLVISFLLVSSLARWGQAVGRVLGELSTGRIPPEVWTLAVSVLLTALFGPYLWASFVEKEVEWFQMSHLLLGAVMMTIVAWLGWIVVIFLYVLGAGLVMSFQDFIRDAIKAYSNR